ncbi:MAG: hypothetical protein F7B95_00840 [Desulfurococcales archaeon]|nr:hypothetical protein [Desulfurococcales archaeon]
MEIQTRRYSSRRRGQANLVTIAILVGATLVMALALMSYFTGQASRASEERGLSDYLATLSYSIDTSIVARYSYTTTDYTGYCYVVQVAWAQGTPIRLYLTVLPASRISPNTVNVDTDLLKYVPRNVVVNPGSPIQTVYLYLVSDVDADGIVELVGKGNTVVSEYLPSCYEMLTNETLQLYELSPINTPMENLYLTPDITLEAFASQAGISYEIPVWNLEFSVDESVRDLFVFIKVPTGVDANSLNLLFLGVFNNNYYTSYYAPLPPP